MERTERDETSAQGFVLGVVLDSDVTCQRPTMRRQTFLVFGLGQPRERQDSEERRVCVCDRGRSDGREG